MLTLEMYVVSTEIKHGLAAVLLICLQSGISSLNMTNGPMITVWYHAKEQKVNMGVRRIRKTINSDYLI